MARWRRRGRGCAVSPAVDGGRRAARGCSTSVWPHHDCYLRSRERCSTVSANALHCEAGRRVARANCSTRCCKMAALADWLALVGAGQGRLQQEQHLKARGTTAVFAETRMWAREARPHQRRQGSELARPRWGRGSRWQGVARLCGMLLIAAREREIVCRANVETWAARMRHSTGAVRRLLAF